MPLRFMSNSSGHDVKAAWVADKSLSATNCKSLLLKDRFLAILIAARAYPMVRFISRNIWFEPIS